MWKKIALAVVAAGGVLAVTAPAHAAGHVSLSIGLPIPGVYAAPAPAYYGPPAPTYYEAPPVVYEQPVYPAYYGPGYGYYGPRVIVRGGPYWHGGGYHHGGWHR